MFAKFNCSFPIKRFTYKSQFRKPPQFGVSHLHRYMSTSASDDNQTEDKQVDFPYVFLNSEEIIQRPEYINDEEQDIMTRFLDFDQNESPEQQKVAEEIQKEEKIPKMKYSIAYTYVKLLKAIVENNTKSIG